MKAKVVVVASVIALVEALGLSQVPTSAANRRIQRDTRYTIASQLRPNDRHVIFEYNGDPPLMVGGPERGGSQLEWLAKKSQVILVVRVEVIQSRLVQRDLVFNEREVAAEFANWIVSDVRVRIDDVIKGGDEIEQSNGGQLILRVEGGNATIQGTMVEAVVPWEAPMESGKQYLLFGHMNSGAFSRDYVYGVNANTGLLMRMTRSSVPGRPELPVSDDVEQWPLPQAAMIIRDAAK